MLNTEFVKWKKMDISSTSDLVNYWCWWHHMNIQRQVSPFLPSLSKSPSPNQLISSQNIFFILTLTVKAILILNKTMLARPEFLLKQATHNALTTNFLALDSTAFAAHHV